MSLELHHRLPWNTLAAENAALEGEIDASELAPRLGEALALERPAGFVRYELHFAPGPDGKVHVSGHLGAELDAICQRCLQPFRLPLDVDVSVSVADSPPQARHDRLPADTDVPDEDEADAEVLGSLADLVEEELLLAIPFLPRHELSECPAASPETGQESGESESRRPFAGLREAMERSREGESG